MKKFKIIINVDYNDCDDLETDEDVVQQLKQNVHHQVQNGLLEINEEIGLSWNCKISKRTGTDL